MIRDPRYKDVVIDASFAVTLVLPEPFSQIANSLITAWEGANIMIMAPSLFGYEITNAVYKRVLHGELTLAQANLRLESILTRNIRLIYDPALHQRSAQIARAYGRPASYDAHYLALAEREGCDFWTGDERLYNSVKSHLSWVHWVGEPQVA